MLCVSIKKRLDTGTYAPRKDHVNMDREKIAHCKSVREASEGMVAAGGF